MSHRPYSARPPHARALGTQIRSGGAALRTALISGGSAGLRAEANLTVRARPRRTPHARRRWPHLDFFEPLAAERRDPCSSENGRWAARRGRSSGGRSPASSSSPRRPRRSGVLRRRRGRTGGADRADERVRSSRSRAITADSTRLLGFDEPACGAHRSVSTEGALRHAAPEMAGTCPWSGRPPPG